MSAVRALRRRPVVVPGLHYTGEADLVALRAFVAAAHGREAGADTFDLVAELADGVNVRNELHGQWLRIAVGEWVVAGTQVGDVYPLAQVELEATYELVDWSDMHTAGAASAAWERLEGHQLAP